MITFDEALSRIEESAEAPCAPPLRRIAILAPVFDLSVSGAEGALERARAAYLRAQESAARDPSREAEEAIARELQAARDDANRLRRLRRRVAWMLHPDRGAGAARIGSLSLARVNAEIDDALLRCEANAAGAGRRA